MHDVHSHWYKSLCGGRSVDELHRGKGLGRRLIRAAKDLAAEHRAITLHLTSRPERVAANALYVSEGFERRETNVYCIRL